MSVPVSRCGRVVYGDGRVAANALVWVEAGTAPTPEIGIRADGRGRFRVALPAGCFTLYARGPDGAIGAAVQRFDVEAGGPIVITLDEPCD